MATIQHEKDPRKVKWIYIFKRKEGTHERWNLEGDGEAELG